MATLIADKGYDDDDFRAEIVGRGAKPIIPNKSTRINPHSFNERAYKGRNVIERGFCRLKDFQRVATRYDKLAKKFLDAVHRTDIVINQRSIPPRNQRDQNPMSCRPQQDGCLAPVTSERTPEHHRRTHHPASRLRHVADMLGDDRVHLRLRQTHGTMRKKNTAAANASSVTSCST